jgi:hypothetical protein
MAMVITSRLLLLKKQAAYSDYLVNFERAQTPLSGQFSSRANNVALRLCLTDRSLVNGIFSVS